MGAVLHAPGSSLDAQGALTVYGSVLARDVRLGGELTVHYDRAILSSGVVCGVAASEAIR